MPDKITSIAELKREIEVMIGKLEQKAKWKELFYQNGQSRGKFAASPWTENIYPWLKKQLEDILKLINSFEVSMRERLKSIQKHLKVKDYPLEAVSVVVDEAVLEELEKELSRILNKGAE